MNAKPFKLVVVILPILMLVAVLFMACASAKPAPTSSPTPAPSLPTASPSPTPTQSPLPTQSPSPTQSPKPGQSTTIYFAHYVASDYIHSRVDSWFMDEVVKRTGGRVKFTTYWAGTILGPVDLSPGLSRGIIDFIDSPAASYNPDMVPLSTIASQLFITENPETQARAMDELYRTHPALQAEMEKNKFKYLYTHGTPPTILAFSKPVTLFSEIKGKKIRVTGGLPKAIAAAGGVPVAIPFAEVFEGMQRGAIDGVSAMPFDIAVQYKVHEVAPYIVDPGIGTYGIGIGLMNLDKWKSLPPDVQQVFEDVAKGTIDKLMSEQVGDFQRTVDIAVKAGAKISKFSAEEKAKWRAAAAKTILDEWVASQEGKGLPGKDVFEKYTQLIKKYEAIPSKYISAFDIYEKTYKK